MPKKCKISDLYVVGKELALDDGKGNSLTVWLQKMSPVDHESALRRSNGVRARVLSLKHLDDDSDEKMEYMGDVMESCPTFDDMVMFLSYQKLNEIRDARTAEVASEDEWAEDDYLQSLHDAWADGCKDLYFLTPEDDKEGNEDYDEAVRVYNEIQRFDAQVEKVLDSELRGFNKEFSARTFEKLMSQLIDAFIETQAAIKWIAEYRRYELFYGCREANNHSKRIFATRQEVDEISSETFIALTSAFQLLDVDIVEGKD